MTQIQGWNNTNGYKKYIFNLYILYFFTKQCAWLGTYCLYVILLFTLAKLTFFRCFLLDQTTESVCVPWWRVLNVRATKLNSLRQTCLRIFLPNMFSDFFQLLSFNFISFTTSILSLSSYLTKLETLGGEGEGVSFYKVNSSRFSRIPEFPSNS